MAAPPHRNWWLSRNRVRAVGGRSVSLRILCDQLEHTQANLALLEAEIEQLLTNDPQVKGLRQIPEFGSKTVAVLRAELGDVQRFARTDEVIAYGGMDIEIKESGLWKGKAKLSKRGSGLLRRMLYLAALRGIHQAGSADCEPPINAWWSAVSKKAQP
jgi:transposase